MCRSRGVLDWSKNSPWEIDLGKTTEKMVKIGLSGWDSELVHFAVE